MLRDAALNITHTCREQRLPIAQRALDRAEL